MFLNVHEVSILVATLLAVAVGSIWYSPLVFGKYWMQAVGLTEETMTTTKSQIIKLLSLGFVVYALLLFTLAQFVMRWVALGESIWPLATLLTLLLGSAIAVSAVWERRSLAYIAINVGYMGVVVFGGMSVIAYWPW